MAGGFDMDALMDALAERVAAKVRADLTNGGAATIKPRLLTVELAAVYLGRSKEAIQHMVASRRLPVVRDGRRVFLDVRELDKWIDANTEMRER